jgi:hypothetical protein
MKFAAFVYILEKKVQFTYNENTIINFQRNIKKENENKHTTKIMSSHFDRVAVVHLAIDGATSLVKSGD